MMTQAGSYGKEILADLDLKSRTLGARDQNAWSSDLFTMSNLYPSQKSPGQASSPLPCSVLPSLLSFLPCPLFFWVFLVLLCVLKMRVMNPGKTIVFFNSSGSSREL